MTQHRVTTAAGITAILSPETRVSIPRRDALGNVEQVPLTGRSYATGMPGLYKSAQTTVTTTVRGRTAQEARNELEKTDRQLRTATRIYDGARFLPILRVATFDSPSEGFAGLSWKLSVTYDLQDPRYYLGPDDQRPRWTPLEMNSGLYVLGAAEIIGGGDHFADLLPLDGVTFVPSTYTARFSGITYQILEVNYVSE